MTILSDNRPGFSVVRKLREVQAEKGVEPNKLGRLFGVSPLCSEGTSWFKGARGEFRVGALLNSLKSEGYVVLHSVPIGKDGSDFDHVVVSLTGKVFVLNTKHHVGAKVVEGKSAVFVNGVNYHYVAKSVYEGKRTGKLLGVLTGSPEVFPVLVFVGVGELSERKGKSVGDVKLVRDSGVLAWIRSVEAGGVSEGFDVSPLMVSSFWSPVVEEVVDQDELFGWFGGFEKDVSRAGSRNTLWKLGGLLGLLGVIAGVLFTVGVL